MDLTNLKDLKAAMAIGGISAKKSLGQNFLIDREALERIVATAQLAPGDTVIEVGPGLGVLTEELVKAVGKAGRVIALEADRELAALLTKRDYSNLAVVAGDALEYDLSTISTHYKVVANVPYYITSVLLRKFLEADHKPSSISVLVQKEVAERIVAKPGNMSILACSVQYYGTPKLVGIVPAASFHPAPKIDSAILHIQLLPEPLFGADNKKLFRLIKAGFGEKRKMLRNSLAGGLAVSSEQATKLIAATKLKPTARAQELSMSEWQQLYDAAIRSEILT